jgi:uncharacterized repeat protein (TIGR01451 family)
MNICLLTALLPFCAAEGTMPPPPAAPLLFVRFVGPEGVRVTVRPGSPEARTFDAPTVAGFRPGYGYRLQLSNIPEQPGRVLSPSLEVLSTLHVPPTLRAEDYPATITFSEEDLRRALSGGLITKVIYLEDPMQAPAMTSTPDRPIEFDVLHGHNPLEEARALGRPVAIVRLGERDVPPQELAAMAISGTVLAPGDAGLPTAAAPPTLPRVLWQWYDPILGPKKPVEEILPDGGDYGPRVGLGPDGHLGGLNPTDTAAEYRYGLTARRVTFSNRVCLFAPRFAILRAETLPIGEGVIIAPAKTALTVGQSQMIGRMWSLETENIIAARGFHTKVGVRGIQSRMGVAEIEKVVGVVVIGAVEGVQTRGTVIEVASATQVQNECRPDQPLVVTKYAQPMAPRPGDIVTFVLRYENYGAKPVHDLIVADSLASRYEYIPGSAQADRDVVFTIQMNEVYSALLRWEVSGDLMPGQHGLIRFQARVR